MASIEGTEHPLRNACVCGSTEGLIRERGAQDCVFCSRCGRFQYNAPRVETGKAVRSVSATHNGIKPKQRARIIERATGRCELCGNAGTLHVGHLLSAKDGLEQGFADHELNDDENLAALCDACNLGLGSKTVPLRLVIAIQMRRIRMRSDP